jgi:hypothetical protein
MTGDFESLLLSPARNRLFSKLQLLWFLPIIWLTPLLTRPIPGRYHAAREVAGYFQGLAYVREPFASFFYNTPEENLSSVHFHSLLSGVLTRLGYTEGGRLVSFVAAAVALTVVGYIAYNMFGRVAGITAPFGLIAHPMFIRQATAYQPETLSIALTALAVFLYVRFYDMGDRRLLGYAYVVLIASIMTHLWEAVILLPLVTVSLYYRSFRDAARTASVGVGTVGVLYQITHLQPSNASSLTGYGTMTHGHWQLLFEPTWWLHYFPLGESLTGILTEPLSIMIGITLPLGVVWCVFWMTRALRTWGLEAWLLASWFVSGLAIPLLLSRGFLGHDYYLWGLFVPLALTFGWGVEQTVETVESLNVALPVAPANIALAIIVVVGTVPAVNIVAGEASEEQSITGDGELPAVEVGKEIRSYGIDDPNKIAFVGLDSTENVYRYSFVSRILIYSEILVRGRNTGVDGPSILNSTDEITDERVVVYVPNGTVKRV